MKVNKSLWFATFFVFSIGAIVSIYSMLAGKDLISKIDTIVSTQIPQTESIIQLNTLIIKYEQTLYAKFVNKDESEASLNELARQIQNQIQQLVDGQYFNESSQFLNQRFLEIQRYGDQLQKKLNIASEQTNAFNLLERISLKSNEIDVLLLQMRKEINSLTNAENLNNQSLIKKIVNIFVSYSIVILVFIFLFVVMLGKQKQHNKNHELLKTFPQLNPSPVLSINKRMSIEYLNPSGQRTLDKLFGQTNTPSIFILPKDYISRLNYMKQNKVEFDKWIEDINGVAHQYKVHYVMMHEEYHIYIENIQKENDTKERLQYFAYHDPNTGLPNRRKLEENIESFQNIQNSLQTDIYLGMLQFVGVSHVISALGNDGIEMFYKQVIERINRGVNEVLIDHEQEASYVYQYEGSVLSLLIVDHTQNISISLISRKLETIFKQSFFIQNQQFNLQIQQGYAKAQMHEKHEEIMRNAFTALHSLYFQESQNIAIYNVQIGQKINQRFEIEQNLRKAISANQLSLVFQPQISLKDNQITGFEVLLRWCFEDRFVSPAVFIPIAEESNLIFSIGEWVLEQSIKQVRVWLNNSLLRKGQKIAINVSVKQFMRTDFVESLSQLLMVHNVDGRYIELELTESLYVDDIEIAINRMKSVRKLNVSLALDDFGTGYCSFSYLGRYPVDKMKIDKAFVDGIGNNEEDAVLYSMIEMGHVLNMQVLTEGVESEEQAQLLKNFGCDSIQGYLFSKPLSVNDATLLLMYFQTYNHEAPGDALDELNLLDMQQAEMLWAKMGVPEFLSPASASKH
ncbi:putative bifunctional diguanylate cyclase/phosphodiesterase [Marinicellulosiphila megalodicopiae]|uniref:putative bifunctional diguanylate cyclase/phosphodiesterase n=1 Tax=Marinicellulosiphila megalodicopiae TaxID=2724896 RepID=UPI003BAFD46D